MDGYNLLSCGQNSVKLSEGKICPDYGNIWSVVIRSWRAEFELNTWSITLSVWLLWAAYCVGLCLLQCSYQNKALSAWYLHGKTGTNWPDILTHHTWLHTQMMPPTPPRTSLSSPWNHLQQETGYDGLEKVRSGILQVTADVISQQSGQMRGVRWSVTAWWRIYQYNPSIILANGVGTRHH